MSGQDLDPQRRLIAQRAIEWWTLLQAGELGVKERAELADWLRASPLHIDEMLRISMVDADLGGFKNWQKYLKDAETLKDGDWDTQHDNVIALNEYPVPAARRRTLAAPWVGLALAAGMAAIAVFGGWLYAGQEQSIVRTEAGQRQEFTLADGSIVDLAPRTELHVQLKERQRLIKLVRGQAFFQVAKDVNRPFIVDAGNTRVRAVGTAFNVERGTSEVTVTVAEGRVAVMRASPLLARVGMMVSRSPDVFVSANEQVVVAQADTDTAVRPVDGAQASAWTDGKLVFKNEKVSDAIYQFNLYNRAQIRVTDEQLAMQRVSGIFNASDPESFVAFVKVTTSNPATSSAIRLDQPEN